MKISAISNVQPAKIARSDARVPSPSANQFDQILFRTADRSKAKSTRPDQTHRRDPEARPGRSEVSPSDRTDAVAHDRTRPSREASETANDGLTPQRQQAEYAIDNHDQQDARDTQPTAQDVGDGISDQRTGQAEPADDVSFADIDAFADSLTGLDAQLQVVGAPDQSLLPSSELTDVGDDDSEQSYTRNNLNPSTGVVPVVNAKSASPQQPQPAVAPVVNEAESSDPQDAQAQPTDTDEDQAQIIKQVDTHAAVTTKQQNQDVTDTQAVAGSVPATGHTPLQAKSQVNAINQSVTNHQEPTETVQVVVSPSEPSTDQGEDDAADSQTSSQQRTPKRVLAAPSLRVEADTPQPTSATPVHQSQVAVSADPSPTSVIQTTGSGLETPGTQPGSQSIESDANVARVIRGMHGVVNQQGGAVTLRLSPPDMGIVRIEMQLNAGTVTAQFHTEHESARSLLTQQLGQLRQALEAQGLTVDKLHVQTMSGDSATNNNTSRDNADPSAHDGRSRGQYTGSGRGGQRGSDSRESQRGDGSSSRDVATFEQTLNTTT